MCDMPQCGMVLRLRHPGVKTRFFKEKFYIEMYYPRFMSTPSEEEFPICVFLDCVLHPVCDLRNQ
jgi:hypothetical protein